MRGSRDASVGFVLAGAAYLLAAVLLSLGGAPLHILALYAMAGGGLVLAAVAALGMAQRWGPPVLALGALLGGLGAGATMALQLDSGGLRSIGRALIALGLLQVAASAGLWASQPRDAPRHAARVHASLAVAAVGRGFLLTLLLLEGEFAFLAVDAVQFPGFVLAWRGFGRLRSEVAPAAPGPPPIAGLK